MTNPTSNFGWQMPTPTDLVTDLPADFEVFGQAVDTTMADLKGGTSGQILSKNTNTDMDFVWVDNQVGDITAVTADAPLTGGGTTGAISIGIQDGTTTQKGAVQLTDSTSSTSVTTAATPKNVKAAYDLANTANTTANAAIPASTATTAGDILFRNGSGITRLGIGTAGQVLKVNTGATAPEWGTASAASGLSLITSQSFSASTAVNVNSVFSSTYYNYRIIVRVTTGTAGGDGVATMRLRSSGTDTTTNYATARGYFYSTTIGADSLGSTSWGIFDQNSSYQTQSCVIDLFNPNQSLRTQGWVNNPKTNSTNLNIGIMAALLQSDTTSFDGFSIYPASGNITGTVEVYGYAK